MLSPSTSREYRRGLTGLQRSLLTAGIVVTHLAAGWGLLQIDAVRDTMAAAAPMMFSLVEPAPRPMPPPPAQLQPKVLQPAPLISTPTPSPAAIVTEPPEPEPVTGETPQPVQVEMAPAAAPPAPKMIPPSAVQYLVEPPLQYPRASRKLKESGRVIVRVFVDEGGLPRVVQVRTTSGFPRLDEAGIAAVEKARFKPYTENGRATAGWALIPLDFDLET